MNWLTRLFIKDPETKKRRQEEKLRELLAETEQLTKKILDQQDEQVFEPERDRFEFDEIPLPNDRLPTKNIHHIQIVYAKRFGLELSQLESGHRDRVVRSIRHYAGRNDRGITLKKKTAGIKPHQGYFIKSGNFIVIYQVLDGKIKFLSIVKR